MAFRIENQFPLDRIHRKVIGTGISFSSPGVFSKNYSTQDQLKDNLINYLMTNKGERYFDPEFGANLNIFLFEQLEQGTFDFIKEKVQNDIKDLFPDVNILKLDVYGNEDTNILRIKLTYNIVNFGIEDTLEIKLT
jgi:phage baseplate assembly protein W